MRHRSTQGPPHGTYHFLSVISAVLKQLNNTRIDQPLRLRIGPARHVANHAQAWH